MSLELGLSRGAVNFFLCSTGKSHSRASQMLKWCQDRDRALWSLIALKRDLMGMDDTALSAALGLDSGALASWRDFTMSLKQRADIDALLLAWLHPEVPRFDNF